MTGNRSEENQFAWLRIAGQCMFIPIYLALFPIAFYHIGKWLDGWFETSGIKVFFLFLGLFSGFRQTYFLIKQLIEIQERDGGS